MLAHTREGAAGGRSKQGRARATPVIPRALVFVAEHLVGRLHCLEALGGLFLRRATGTRSERSGRQRLASLWRILASERTSFSWFLSGWYLSASLRYALRMAASSARRSTPSSS
eukprot:scaffold518_cov388-Prasinococcus_capsulatus_cf.AAC.67